MTNEGDLGMGIEPQIRRTGPQGKPARGGQAQRAGGTETRRAGRQR